MSWWIIRLFSFHVLLRPAFSLQGVPAVQNVTHNVLRTNPLAGRETNNVSSPLTILPIGDSITDGYRSTDGNGYRLYLRDMLIGAGYTVDFIGPLSHGANNSDNQEAGYGGFTILDIQTTVLASGVLLSQPDLILLMAGTNDIDRDPPPLPWDSAPQRLGALIDVILLACPSAAVLVATLIQNEQTIIHGTGREQERVDTFNAAVPGILAQRASQGHLVKLVNDSTIGGYYLSDGLHPNDPGYQILAQNWFNAVQSLPSGWIANAQRAMPVVSGLAASQTVSALPSSTTAPASPSATTSDGRRTIVMGWFCALMASIAV